MKIKHLLILPVILASAACNKTESGTVPEDPVLKFKITSEQAVTKAEQTAAESNMETLDIFVFMNVGTAAAPSWQLEAYDHSTPRTNSATVKVKVQKGAKKIAVAANLPDGYAATVASLADFTSLSYSFAQNSRTRMTMLAQTDKDVTADADVPISLVRHVARVELLKVTNSLPPALGDMTLEGAWLHNVRKVHGSTADADGDFWRMTDIKGSAPALVKQMMNASEAVSAGKFTGTLSRTASWNANSSEKYYCYGYPNSAAPASVDTGKDHVTKFVIQASIKGNTYYYPIAINGMESNKTYVISHVEIKRLGSNDPDKYVTSATMNVTIQVKDWVPESLGEITF